MSGVDSAGDPSFDSASPRTISVRWEDRVDMFINQQGEQEASRSIVVVTESFKVGDFLFLGTSVAADPDGVVGAYQIKQYEEVPDKQGKAFLRRCRL